MHLSKRSSSNKFKKRDALEKKTAPWEASISAESDEN
jgi:hypothetical protein